MGKSVHKGICILGENNFSKNHPNQITGSVIEDYLVVMTSPLKFAKTPSHLPPKTLNKCICL